MPSRTDMTGSIAASLLPNADPLTPSVSPSPQRTPSSSGTSSPFPPLSIFTRLSSKVSLYDPTSTGSKIAAAPPAKSTSPFPASQHPTTIIFCSWMNGKARNIDYYTRKYAALYPNARIILSTMDTVGFMLHSEARRRRDVATAVDAILATASPNSPDAPLAHERILVHALSNGGGKRFYAIAATYRKRTGQALPVTAFILDSAPGIPRFRRDIHALMVPAGKFNWALWLPFAAVIVSMVSVVYVVVNWLPRWVWYQLVWGPTEGLNSFDLIDGPRRRAPAGPTSTQKAAAPPADRCVRGYIYSEEDEVIDSRDVENHAAVAERNGHTVLRCKVRGAGHVQLFRGEGGESAYWGFLERVWKRGLGVAE